MQQETLFDEIFNQEQDVTVKFPNSHARGEFSFAQKEIIKSGERRKLNAFTVNSAKVSDFTTQMLQKNYKGKLDYYKIRKEAEERLIPFFEKHNLLDIHAGKSIRERNKRWINIKIEEEVHKNIKKIISDYCEIKISFSDFFGQLNIPSLYKGDNIRFDRAVELVLEVQSKSFCNYVGKRIVEKEDGTIEEVSFTGKSALVPTIEFEFDEALGDIRKIEDLIASKKRNKAKYIKAVVFKFDPDTFAQLVSPGREYVLANREKRGTLESIHAFRLDLLIRSIEKIQHYSSVNHYTLDDLNRIFGVSYTQFSHFRGRILNPAIQELNKSEDLKISFKEIKKGNRFEYLYFIITRNKTNLSGEYKDFDLPYYIAVQHYYFDEYIKGDVAEDFMQHYYEIKSHTEKISQKRDYCFGGKKSKDHTLDEWEEEYTDAIEAYEKLIIATTDDAEWFEQKGIKVCTKRLCFIDVDTNEIYEPYKGLFDTHNPIRSYAYYLAEKEREKKEN